MHGLCVKDETMSPQNIDAYIGTWQPRSQPQALGPLPLEAHSQGEGKERKEEVSI